MATEQMCKAAAWLLWPERKQALGRLSSLWTLLHQHILLECQAFGTLSCSACRKPYSDRLMLEEDMEDLEEDRFLVGPSLKASTPPLECLDAVAIVCLFLTSPELNWYSGNQSGWLH